MTCTVRAAAIATAGLVALAATGCEVLRDEDVTFTAGHVVVGSTFEAVARDACMACQTSKCTRLCWDDPIVEVLDVSVDDPDIFVIEAVEATGTARVQMRAVREGSSTLRIRVVDEDGDEKSAQAELNAYPLGGLRIASACPHDEPAFVPVSATLPFDLHMLSPEGLHIFGVLDEPLDLAASAGQLEPPSDDSGQRAFIAPDTPAAVTLSSADVPDFEDSIAVYGVDEISGLEVAAEPSPNGSHRRIIRNSVTYTRTDEPCLHLTRTLRAAILTPDICSLDADTDVDESTTEHGFQGSYFFAWGQQAGTCSIEVELVGSDLPPVIVDTEIAADELP